ncbi:MAG: Hsp20/alpha crystallin family protein [Chlamydiales bacterium]|nr:Hsp20/alpha crystallin family protein [Chlamydiales bacterium]
MLTTLNSGSTMSKKHKLVSRSFWSFPAMRFPFSLFDEEEEGWLQEFSDASGLSVSEDEQSIYIEAAVPGIKPENIETTFDKGLLWIKAERREEDKGRKFYRRAVNVFSYRIAVPGNIDESRQPEATCRDGILTIAFPKAQKALSKKIPVKATV